MANQEHVDLLRRGATEWNQWRNKYPETRPDLSGTNLSETDLRGTDLRRTHLTSANLSRANLTSANLSAANLIGADLSEADLFAANLIGATLSEANFRGSILTSAGLSRATLTGGDLREADLGGANLFEANLIGATLRATYLCGAHLRRANLRSTTLTGANLREADLREADLFAANLTGADLTGANLIEANLTSANLTGANLSEANLTSANLTSADLTSANLHRAIFSSTTLAGLDLRSVKGLLEIQHEGPSIIQLHSIQLPQDGSALHFLRGVGTPDEWIDFYRASMMHPIQYHSCFISYASDNKDAANRLHADLQANGVRCWFAPHDLKPGDYFREEIDKAIHVQDKLLLILSGQSVNSKWVRYEVNRALDREVNQERAILFPIRIDDSVLHTKDDWAASLRSSRHIGNFTRWQEHQGYQEAFTYLLKHLKDKTK